MQDYVDRAWSALEKAIELIRYTGQLDLLEAQRKALAEEKREADKLKSMDKQISEARVRLKNLLDELLGIHKRLVDDICREPTQAEKMFGI